MGETGNRFEGGSRQILKQVPSADEMRKLYRQGGQIPSSNEETVEDGFSPSEIVARVAGLAFDASSTVIGIGLATAGLASRIREHCSTNPFSDPTNRRRKDRRVVDPFVSVVERDERGLPERRDRDADRRSVTIELVGN